jgi:putative hydrolase of the HAD superfamily
MVRKSQIGAVTFDLWETLLFEEDGSNSQRTAVRCKNLADALNAVGIKSSEEQVKSAMDKTILALLKIWENNRDISHLGQLRLFLKRVNSPLKRLKKGWIKELSAAYVSPIFEVPPYLNPDAERLFEWLGNLNEQIGLICNTGLTPGAVLREFLRQKGVAELFDVTIFSDEVRIRKPDTRIFKLTARALNVKPDAIIHIGDNLTTDIWGAKNAGFKAIHLSSEEGHDRKAEADPDSLVSLSKRLGHLNIRQRSPDGSIHSLKDAIQAIEELEKPQ